MKYFSSHITLMSLYIFMILLLEHSPQLDLKELVVFIQYLMVLWSADICSKVITNHMKTLLDINK